MNEQTGSAFQKMTVRRTGIGTRSSQNGGLKHGRRSSSMPTPGLHAESLNTDMTRSAKPQRELCHYTSLALGFDLMTMIDEE